MSDQRAKAVSPGAARPPLTALQVLVIVGLIAGLLVMLDFNRRQSEARRLEADRDRAGTEVAQLDREHAALLTQVAYATTDAAVIDWAHSNGKLVQEGEVLVVPVLPTPGPTAAPPAPTPRPAPPTWTEWWELFFDTLPPVKS